MWAMVGRVFWKVFLQVIQWEVLDGGGGACYGGWQHSIAPVQGIERRRNYKKRERCNCWGNLQSLSLWRQWHKWRQRVKRILENSWEASVLRRCFPEGSRDLKDKIVSFLWGQVRVYQSATKGFCHARVVGPSEPCYELRLWIYLKISSVCWIDKRFLKYLQMNIDFNINEKDESNWSRKSLRFRWPTWSAGLSRSEPCEIRKWVAQVMVPILKDRFWTDFKAIWSRKWR